MLEQTVRRLDGNSFPNRNTQERSRTEKVRNVYEFSLKIKLTLEVPVIAQAFFIRTYYTLSIQREA